MKTTVILTGMIVILSLTLPAVQATGGSGEQRPEEGQPPNPERMPEYVYDLIMSFGIIEPFARDRLPQPHLPVPPAPDHEKMPQPPPNGGSPGGQDPAQYLPCDLPLVESSSCGQNPPTPGEPETPDTPESPDAPEAPAAPAPPTPPSARPEDVQTQVDAATGTLTQKKDQSEGILASILAPVQAAAKGAADGARLVITGVVTTAGFVADEASAQATDQATQVVAIATGLVDHVSEALDDLINPEAPLADDEMRSVLVTQGAGAPVVERPAGIVTLGLIAVGSLGLIALAFAGARKLLGLGGLALLSRIPSKDIMKNDTRAAIFEIVQNDPGVSLNEIVDRLGLSRNAVAYHLAVFESEKTVVSVKDGKYRRYFVNGGKYVNGAKDVVSTIKNEVTLNVIRYILDHPGAMQKEVCTAVGTSPSATNWHINRLEKVGLVEKAKVANTVRYSPGPSFNKYDLNEFGLVPMMA